MELCVKTEEEVRFYVSKLSNEELSRSLKAHNQKSGPIIRQTRTLYEKRLRDILVEFLRNKDNSGKASDHQKENKTETLNKDDVDEESKGDGKVSVEQKILDDSEQKCDQLKPKKSYYAVQVPTYHNKKGPYVFESHSETMKFLQSLRGSRFKIFNDPEKAKEFSQEAKTSGEAFSKLRDEQSPECTGGTNSKESLPFRSVDTAKLNEFRKLLEIGDVGKAKKLIWSNPRHLVGNGDNPMILQAGCLYNALHVTAKLNQLEATRLVVDTITNPDFFHVLYGDEMPDTREARMNFMVDLYLNGREKILLDTPLHLACKFGHEEVVRYLLSLPFIDRSLKNRDGLTPIEVVCSRVTGDKLRSRIVDSFEDQYYVFVFRSEDNTEPPQVSLPFCPNVDRPEPLVPHGRSPRSFRTMFQTPESKVTFGGLGILEERNGPKVAKISELNSPMRGICPDVKTSSGLKSRGIEPHSPLDRDGCINIKNLRSTASTPSTKNTRKDSISSHGESKSRELPPDSPPESCSSARLHSTASDSTPESAPGTPKNPRGNKVSVLCNTPSNKRLILLADSEQAPTPRTPNNRVRFETPESQRTRPGDFRTPKDVDRWERLVNIPVFSATEIPKRIRGIAGPMSARQSQKFRQSVLRNRVKSDVKDPLASVRRIDSNKGLERACRQVARELEVPWCEHWDFLSCSVDLTSKCGLERFEEYMKEVVDFSVSICEPDEKSDDSNELTSFFSKLTLKSPPSNSKKKEQQGTLRGKRDDDDGEFVDARDKLDDAEEFFELNSRRNVGMFIHGDVPTRADADAFRALESAEKSLRAYPFIYNWFTYVASHSESDMARWADVSSISHAIATPRSGSTKLLDPLRNYDSPCDIRRHLCFT